MIANSKQVIEGMNAAMNQINENQAMNRLAADLGVATNGLVKIIVMISDMFDI
jgi:hypothetical protein